MEKGTRPASSTPLVPEDDSLAHDEAAAAGVEDVEARKKDGDSPRVLSSTAQSTGMPAGVEG